MLLNPYRFGTVESLPGLPTTGGVLRMWLDAADATTLTVSGGRVSGWRCKTSAITFAQAAPTTQPVIKPPALSGLNHNAVMFEEDTQQWLAHDTGINISVPQTVFTVVYWGTRGNQYSSIAVMGTPAPAAIQGGAGAPYVLIYTAVGGAGLAQTSSSNALGTYATSGGIPHDSTGIYEFLTPSANASSSILQNGQTLSVARYGGSTFASPTTYRSIGTSDNLYRANGAFGEIIVYEGILSSTDRDAVREYLKTKWGTP